MAVADDVFFLIFFFEKKWREGFKENSFYIWNILYNREFVLSNNFLKSNLFLTKEFEKEKKMRLDLIIIKKITRKMIKIIHGRIWMPFLANYKKLQNTH